MTYEESLSKKEQGTKDQTMTAWIIVLAVAITCCAVLFVVFANHLMVINRNLSAANTRLTMMESNEIQLLSELQALRHSMIAKPGAQNPSKSQQPATVAPPPSPPASPAAEPVAP